MEMRIMENVTEDAGPGHAHVKYLPDSIVEIFKIFFPDPFDAAFKHYLLDHLSYKSAIETYNAYHNHTDTKYGKLGPSLDLIKGKLTIRHQLHYYNAIILSIILSEY